MADSYGKPGSQRTKGECSPLGKRAEQAGSKPLRVVPSGQGIKKHHTPSHGMGGMAGGPKMPSRKSHKPAHMGGQDHSKGRRRGQGY